MKIRTDVFKYTNNKLYMKLYTIKNIYIKQLLNCKYITNIQYKLKYL